MFTLSMQQKAPRLVIQIKHITCQHAGHLFKFKHNISRGSFSLHILPTYIVVRWSDGKESNDFNIQTLTIADSRKTVQHD